MAFNPNELRDPRGKWTSSGAGAPSGTPAPAVSVRELFGKDLDHPNLSAIKDALDRGVWNIYPTQYKVDKWNGDKVTTLAIEPLAKDIPDTWKVFSEGDRTTAYDPTMAHVEVMTPDHSTVVPNEPGISTFPVQLGEVGKLYRGMSFEEYGKAIADGKIKSSGEYNIGEHEKGLTYFSSDPLQASAYANGFAPWQFKATPTQPAVVVEINDKGLQTSSDPRRPSEIGVQGDIPASAITRVFIGVPVIVDSGRMDVIQGQGKEPRMGSGVSPSSTVVWQEGKVPGAPPSDFEKAVKLASEQEGSVLRGRMPSGPYLLVDDMKNYENVRRVALAASIVAKREDFDPKNIRVTDRDEKFKLNGMDYDKAGQAGYDGVITLYANHMAGSQVFDTTTHEIMHEKFHEFMTDYEAERKQVLALPTTGDYRTDPMKPDGTLREPYATQFPVYQVKTQLMDGTNEDPNLQERMAKEDGCTPYSRDWWTAVEGRTARSEQAINETLAEMAMLRNRDKGSPDAGPPTFKPTSAKGMSFEAWRDNQGFFDPKPSKDWDALYKAVNANWERNAQKRAHRAEWGL